MSAEDEIAKDLERAQKALLEADRFAEIAITASFKAFHALKFGKKNLTRVGQAALDRADKAHEHIGSARGEIANAVYEIEKIVGKRH